MRLWRWMACLGTIAFLVTTRLCNARPALRHHVGHRRLKHRDARIKAIKQEILNKLGLTAVPDIRKVNTTIEEKRKMIKLYKKSLEDGQGRVHNLYNDEEFYAKKFHSFIESDVVFPNSSPRDERMRSGTNLYFHMHIDQPPDPHRELHIHSAKLRLYKSQVFPKNLKDTNNVDRSIRINVYQILSPLNNRTYKKRLVSSKLVSVEERGWETFDVKNAAVSWLDSHHTNFGLELSCDSQDISEVVEFVSISHLKEVEDSAHDKLRHKYSRDKHETVRNIKNSFSEDKVDILDGDTVRDLVPVLYVYTQEILIVGRTKRALDEKQDCVQGDGETRCCRYPLWVSFKDIGWDKWVIAPEGYQAYYCDGKCPHRYKLAHTFAGIQAIIHHFNPAAAPAPCCTATKLSPLNLLHYDERGSLVVSVYEDMVIDKCKCA